MLKIQIFNDESAVAAAAAALIAAEAREAVAARGRFTLAVSGGHTPWLMLEALAGQKLPWDRIHVLQVDERIAPPGDPDRNFTHLRESLLARRPLRAEQVHAMPVDESDLARAAKTYALTLGQVAGSPAMIDLVHLGLGPDGHTASLVPGDSVLQVDDADVAITAGTYQGRRRMTMTYPILDRARRLLWVVTGLEKADALRRLRAGDESIPAGRVMANNAIILADRAAAGKGEEI